MSGKKELNCSSIDFNVFNHEEKGFEMWAIPEGIKVDKIILEKGLTWSMPEVTQNPKEGTTVTLKITTQ